MQGLIFAAKIIIYYLEHDLNYLFITWYKKHKIVSIEYLLEALCMNHITQIDIEKTFTDSHKICLL